MGTLLVFLATAVLTLDQPWEPWFPFLLLLLVLLSGIACWELVQLLPADRRPFFGICLASVWGLILVNWPAHLEVVRSYLEVGPWQWISAAFAVVVGVAFLAEMVAYRAPGNAVPRMALTVWVAAYLGLLPCFLAQLRWLKTPAGMVYQGTLEPRAVALSLAVFVPKCGDIGAYFTGRFLGRRPMAPTLSPKKTWEGAAGGLMVSVGAAIGIDHLGPVFTTGLWGAIGFGLTVGLAGMFGDLAESLIKRDCRQKDASQMVPGFGGVLDVVDSVIFAAPVAYWWFQ
jgi:phosphatidate cytidylyltransferase